MGQKETCNNNNNTFLLFLLQRASKVGESLLLMTYQNVHLPAKLNLTFFTAYFFIPPPIWQVQGPWMQQHSSSHDSNSLLGCLAGQSWTAGMVKILFPSLCLFTHLKSLSPSSLTVPISLSFSAHSGDRPQFCPCLFHLKSPRAKTKVGVGKVLSMFCVCV